MYITRAFLRFVRFIGNKLWLLLRVTEAIKDDERRVETGEKEKREELQVGW